MYYAAVDRLAAVYGPERVTVFDHETLWDPESARARARLLSFVGQRKPWKLAPPSHESVPGGHAPGWQRGRQRTYDHSEATWHIRIGSDRSSSCEV